MLYYTIILERIFFLNSFVWLIKFFWEGVAIEPSIPSVFDAVDTYNMSMNKSILSLVIYLYYWTISSYGLGGKNGYSKYPFKQRFRLPGVRGINDRLSLTDRGIHSLSVERSYIFDNLNICIYRWIVSYFQDDLNQTIIAGGLNNMCVVYHAKHG